MADRESRRAIFVEKRAHALAMMLLTRREDFSIEEVHENVGLDYVVRFQTKGKPGVREFGVGLWANWREATKEDADQILIPALRKLQEFGPFAKPVCLFFFTMENDGAWYSWVAEPMLLEDGRPQLHECDHPDGRLLDKRALKDIARRVDLWYAALFSSLAMNGAATTRGHRHEAPQ